MNLRTPKTLRVGESPLRSTESAEAAYRSFMLSRSSSSKLSGGLGGAAGYGAGAVSEARINPALPRDAETVQAGDLVSAKLCAGEMSIRRVVKALPQDMGRV